MEVEEVETDESQLEEDIQLALALSLSEYTTPNALSEKTTYSKDEPSEETNFLINLSSHSSSEITQIDATECISSEKKKNPIGFSSSFSQVPSNKEYCSYINNSTTSTFLSPTINKSNITPSNLTDLTTSSIEIKSPGHISHSSPHSQRPPHSAPSTISENFTSPQTPLRRSPRLIKIGNSAIKHPHVASLSISRKKNSNHKGKISESCHPYSITDLNSSSTPTSKAPTAKPKLLKSVPKTVIPVTATSQINSLNTTSEEHNSPESISHSSSDEWEESESITEHFLADEEIEDILDSDFEVNLKFSSKSSESEEEFSNSSDEEFNLPKNKRPKKKSCNSKGKKCKAQKDQNYDSYLKLPSLTNNCTKYTTAPQRGKKTNSIPSEQDSFSSSSFDEAKNQTLNKRKKKKSKTRPLDDQLATLRKSRTKNKKKGQYDSAHQKLETKTINDVISDTREYIWKALIENPYNSQPNELHKQIITFQRLKYCLESCNIKLEDDEVQKMIDIGKHDLTSHFTHTDRPKDAYSQLIKKSTQSQSFIDYNAFCYIFKQIPIKYGNTGKIL